MRIANAIKKIVYERDHVTFAELRDLPGFKGPYGISVSQDFENLIAWAGMSAEASKAIIELMTAGEIHMKPTSTLTYLIDGCGLDFPIAKQVRAYKEPHWCPVVLRPGAAPASKRKGAKLAA